MLMVSLFNYGPLSGRSSLSLSRKNLSGLHPKKCQKRFEDVFDEVKKIYDVYFICVPIYQVYIK